MRIWGEVLIGSRSGATGRVPSCAAVEECEAHAANRGAGQTDGAGGDAEAYPASGGRERAGDLVLECYFAETKDKARLKRLERQRGGHGAA